MFVYQKTVKPNKDCEEIINVAVGRSVDRIRIFVTCSNNGGIEPHTNIKIYDKIPKNNEIIENVFN